MSKDLLYKWSLTKLLKEIDSVIRDQVAQTILEDMDTIFNEVLSSYETRLEQQESKHKNLLEQYEAEQAFIYQKQNELQQVERNIEAILHFWQAKKLA